MSDLSSRFGWTLGLLVSLLALIGLIQLVHVVMSGGFTAINTEVATGLHDHASLVLDVPALALSYLGGPSFVGFVGGWFVILRFFQKKPAEAWTLLLLLIGSGLTLFAMKHAFHFPRPQLFKPLVPEDGYGFPSAHSGLSMVLYGYLLLNLKPEQSKLSQAKLLPIVLVLLPLGVMWSRLYLQLHWLSDVLAGALVGLFWLGLSPALTTKLQPKS